MDSHPRLTIRGLRARGLNPVLDRPIETASGVMSTAPLMLIDLSTQVGITGSSYLRCYTPLALQPLVQLVANCADLLTGQASLPDMCNGWDSTGEKEPLGSSFCKREQPRSCCSPGLLSLAGLGLGERIDAGLPLIGKTVAQGATGKLGRPAPAPHRTRG